MIEQFFAFAIAMFIIWIVASPFIFVGVMLTKLAWNFFKLIGMVTAMVVLSVTYVGIRIAYYGVMFYRWWKPVENITVNLADYDDDALAEFMQRMQDWDGKVVINVVDDKTQMKDITPQPKRLPGSVPLWLVK